MPEISPRLLQILEKVKQEGGSVSYVFITERTRFNDEFPLGESYQHITTLNVSINSEVFFDTHNGKKTRRSPQSILQVFEDTMWDNGASYYRIG